QRLYGIDGGLAASREPCRAERRGGGGEGSDDQRSEIAGERRGVELVRQEPLQGERCEGAGSETHGREPGSFENQVAHEPAVGGAERQADTELSPPAHDRLG